MTRRRPAPVWLVVLVAVLFAACSPSPSPAPSSISIPSASASASSGPSASASATVPPAALARWTDCGAGFQCASIRVPRDYTGATPGTFDIALIRLVALDPAHRIGSLIVNPGGPGASGIDLVRGSGTAFPKELRERFDLVGFDPRGVNDSSAVRCIDNLDEAAALDPSPDTAAELAALVRQAEDYADACAKRNAALLPFLSTDAVARDLDRIRIAVGDAKLTYLGFSYGTLIGSVYASLFPTNIRAMVLDGAIDPALTEPQLRLGQAVAFEGALKRFLAWCSGTSKCAFREGGGSAKAYDALMAAIERKPLPTPQLIHRRSVGPGLAFSAVLGSLYNRSSWPSLGIALELAKRGDGSGLVLLSDPFRGRKPDGSYSNQSDAYFANTCLDYPVQRDVAGFTALADKMRTVAPHFRAAAYNDLTCAYWSVPPERTPGPVSDAGAPPVVVVGSTGDPATPYAWAVNLAKELTAGILVIRKGEGHTGLLVSACVQKAADAYLIGLTDPKNGLICAS